MLYHCSGVKGHDKFPVVMRPGVTPVPIPNTTVKPEAAASTTLETTWEARWLPEPYQVKYLDRTLKIEYRESDMKDIECNDVTFFCEEKEFKSVEAFCLSLGKRSMSG